MKCVCLVMAYIHIVHTQNVRQTNILIDVNDILFKLHVRCPFYNHAATFIVVYVVVVIVVVNE